MPCRDEQDLDFFARTIQLWYRYNKKEKNYFVIKERCRRKKLTEKQIVSEHIASSLYRLFGVTTPDIRILVDNRADEPNVSLASQYCKHYQDFVQLWGSDEQLFELDEKKTIEERVSFFNTVLLDKQPCILGRETLLVAATCLLEYDLIGTNLTNVGVVPTKINNEYQLVKIDPGAVDLSTPIREFMSTVALENPLLCSTFSSNCLNTPEILTGNLHFKEFFFNLDKEKCIQAIERLAAITDEEVLRHIVRPEYLNFVDNEFLQNIASTIIARKNHLSSLIPASKRKMIDVEPQPVLLPRFYFTKSLYQIPRGNAEPDIVRQYNKEELPKFMRGL